MEPIEDPVELPRLIDRVLRRIARRDDYGQLLACGHVVRRIENITDPYLWRSDIRRQARADRIQVRTRENRETVWAMRPNADSETARIEGAAYLAILREVVPASVAHRHEPLVVARDGEEAVFGCARCPALGYADGGAGVVGGGLVEDECPHESKPRTTDLAAAWGPRESGS